MVLRLTDLEQLGNSALEDFDRQISNTNRSDRERIEKHAERLEAKLEQLYAVAVTVAKGEESLENVAAIWAQMVSICDAMARALSELHAGSSFRLESYDHILDIRNACEENRALHA